MNDEEKLLEEEFDTLPVNLKTAINSVPWKPLIQEIAQINNLDTEKTISLNRETMFVIYDMESPNDYVSNIIENVNIPEDKAYTIAELVANKIFDPIFNIAEQTEKKTALKNNTLGITSEIHPMIEEGEVAHEVPHVETQTKTTNPPEQALQPQIEPQKPVGQPLTPENSKPNEPEIKTKPQENTSSAVNLKKSGPISKNNTYPGGIDPYREPLE